jgi:hypothetical protein
VHNGGGGKASYSNNFQYFSPFCNNYKSINEHFDIRIKIILDGL